MASDALGDDALALGQAVLASQPFSVFLGARLVEFDSRGAVIELPLRPEFAQQFGYVHGGVLSYLADNALTFAGGLALGPQVLTAGYTITYVRPARGEKLIARATVIAAGGRQVACRCDLFALRDGQEYLCATAMGTIMRRPGASEGDDAKRRE